VKGLARLSRAGVFQFQKIKNIAGLVMPYPTLGEINKRAAGSYFTPSLFGGRIKALVRFLLSLGQIVKSV
jgi:hypothetical protein